MLREPSVLLVDDEAPHYENVLAMNLQEDEDEPWVVEGAIGASVEIASKKAGELIRQYEGFTVILLDIMWRYGGEEYGGIKILLDLQKRIESIRPMCRQVLLVTRKASLADPDPKLKALMDKLGIPWDMRKPFLLQTEHGRNDLKECLRELWRKNRPTPTKEI